MKSVKSFIIAIAIAISAMICVPTILVQDNVQMAEAATVKLSKTTSTLNVGYYTTIKLNGTTKKVTWSTSDKDVVTVTSTGKTTAKITAKGMGQATIKAKVGLKTYSCKVTVNGKKTLSDIGKTTTLSVDGTNKTVRWTTSNSSVATVSSSGVVTAKGMGQATIYARLNGTTFSKCVVRVNDVSTYYEIGKSVYLDVHKTNATWTSGNKDVATITSGGKLVTKGVGKVVLTAKVDGDTYATSTVTVRLEDTMSFTAVNKTKTIDAGNTQSEITWKSSNEDVAKVSTKGVVTSKGLGKAYIYGYIDGTLYVKNTVQVKLGTGYKNFSVLGAYYNIPAGDTKADLTWKSTNSDVASVSDSGKVTAKGIGTAIVTGVKDGVTYVTCKVSVKTSKTVELSGLNDTETINVGDTSDKVKWSTSDSSVATVSNGKITSTGAGKAYIYARINGELYGTYTVKVTRISSWSAGVGDSTKFNVGKTQDDLVWSTSDKNVVSVIAEGENAGKVTAEGIGKAYVYGKKYGVTYAKLTVTVKESGSATITGLNETRTCKAGDSKADLEWTSSNPYAVTVSKGTITTVGLGKATITAANKYGTVYGTWNVTVKDSDSFGLSIGGQAHEIVAGLSKSKLTWSSGDTDVAAVSKGKVTAVGLGATKIYAKDNGTTVGTYTVTVTANDDKVIQGFDTVDGFDVGKNAVEWNSLNENVVVVDEESGELTSVGLGTAIVEAKVGDVVYGTFFVTVKATESVGIDGIGNTETLNAGLATVEWESADEAVVTVENGVATAKGLGSAKVYAKINGTVYGTYTVNVRTTGSVVIDGLNKAESIDTGDSVLTLSSDNTNVVQIVDGEMVAAGLGVTTVRAMADGVEYGTYTVKVTNSYSNTRKEMGDHFQLNVGASAYELEYELSNDDVVEMSDSGYIRTKGIGQVTVYMKMAGELLGTQDIIVQKTDSGNFTYIGEEKTFNVGNENAEFSVEDEKVADVDADGKITAAGVGCTTVYASVDGVEYGTYTVLVKTSEEVELNSLESYVTIDVGATQDDMTWTSSDEKVAVVDGDKLMAAGLGTAKITGTYKGFVVAEFDVTVQLPVEDVAMKLNDTEKLAAGNAEVVWAVLSGNDVVTVDEGSVKAVGLGAATVAAFVGEEQYASWNVVVTTEASLEIVGFGNCDSVDYGCNTVLDWTSADSTIATVDSFGTIRAMGEGTTTIYASANGTAYGTFTVTVKDNPGPIDFLKEELIEKDGTVALSENWEIDSFRDVAGILGDLQVGDIQTVPVYTTITYDAENDKIVFVNSIEMSIAFADFAGHEDDENVVNVSSVVTLEYDCATGTFAPMKCKMEGNLDQAIKVGLVNVTKLRIGTTYADLNPETVVPMTWSDGKVQELSNLGFTMSTVSGEALNSITVKAIKQETDIDVTEADVIQTAECQGNMALYSINTLLDCVDAEVTMADFGFTTY